MKLEVKNVDTFHGAIQALRGVSLSIKEGEIVSLIGANGAGKSTLLMTICGHPHPSSGEILFEGQKLSGHKTHQIMRLGISQVPEGRRIFPRMT
ncbi:MAG: ATP-binding cassette domain-containing protein, partial [Alphaproteobacteria bacterium]|nr:ATP-binding cassette domain-containing protein [Alphaproteobacteria bacterium]